MAALSGGAMNAYRFACEQHKPAATFAADDSAETGGNRLIVEAAGRPGSLAAQADLVGLRDKGQWQEWLCALSSSR